MIVMPANSTGWFWHTNAIRYGVLGHLYSPGAQRGPWKHFPYALDNGAFACWDAANNTWDAEAWDEFAWKRLLFWSQAAPIPAKWAIVPDVPGNADLTFARWPRYAPIVREAGIPLAIAVQDGMTTADIRRIRPQPEVIAVGGSTEWKWKTVEQWAADFPRVHLLRCNIPTKLQWLTDLGIESCDGTGWNRGNRTQTAGLEQWMRANASDQFHHEPLWPYVARATKDKHQLTFA